MPKMKIKKDVPKCPKCHTGTYREQTTKGDGRPEFICLQCDYYWTMGKDGGKYKLNK